MWRELWVSSVKLYRIHTKRGARLKLSRSIRFPKQTPRLARQTIPNHTHVASMPPIHRTRRGPVDNAVVEIIMAALTLWNCASFDSLYQLRQPLVELFRAIGRMQRPHSRRAAEHVDAVQIEPLQSL